jgi:hypothetical protein
MNNPTRHFFKPQSILFVLALWFLSGCNNEDPEPSNEEELITTLTLTFQKIDDLGASVGLPISFTWEDLDGSGSTAPTIDAIGLDAHSRYQVSMTLTDKSKTPQLDVAAEVQEEGHEHQFFYVTSSSLQLSFAYNDQDANSLPIGLSTVATTDHESSGTLHVILRHEPVKEASGVSDGDITNADGETDVDAEFPVSIIE